MKEGQIPIWRRFKGIPAALRTHISHICGRSLCRNIKHITRDTQEENESRKKCHDEMRRTNSTRLENCPHSPNCLYFTIYCVLDSLMFLISLLHSKV